MTKEPARREADPPPSSEPLDVICDRFSHFLEQSGYRPRTISIYMSNLQAFARWLYATQGDRAALSNMTHTELVAYARFLSDARRLSPATINGKLAALQCFQTWAGRGNGTRSIPSPRLSVPARSSSRPRQPRWLSQQEQRTLLRVVEEGGNSRDLALVQLLLNTGLQVGELCNLTWREVSLTKHQGHLTVRHTRGNSQRVVPLNATARDALRALMYEAHAGKPVPILIGQRGPMTPRGVENTLEKYTKVAGFEDVSPVTLRHTFCKNLVDVGADWESLVALAGHVSPAMIRSYYELSPQDLSQLVELLEK